MAVVLAERFAPLAAEDALKNGITSFHNMGSSFETLDLLKTMADEGNLPLRLYMATQETAEDMEDKLHSLLDETSQAENTVSRPEPR